VDVIALAVELGQPGLEVRAHVPHDLLQTFQVPRGEHLMPVLGYEDQMRVQDEHTMPASAYVSVIGHETN
jgi:hypothetical protein